MRKRRENSSTFSVERVKSPHVLDLRSKEFLRRRKSPKKKIEGDGLLSRDGLMEELSNLERYEVELASTLRPEGQKIVSSFIPKLIPPQRTPESRISLFWNATAPAERKDSVFLKSRNFAFLSGVLAVALLLGFSIQKGVSLKNSGIQKSVTAYEDFRSAEASFKSLDFTSAAKSFSFAYAELVSVENSLQGAGWLSSALVRHIPRLATSVDSGVALLSAGKHVAKAGEIISSAAGLLPIGDSVSPESFSAFLGKEKDGKSDDTDKRFTVFGQKAEEAERELLSAENEITRVEQDLFPQEFQKAIVELREKLPLLQDGVRILKDYSKILSVLFGEDSPKRYLVIFQNSSEIRPTGGFIGSYAILEISNDKIKNMEVRGIYDADGQLAVNVVPPKPLQHISSAWSTHDANWFFDFPTSAGKISWFFEKTGEEKIDGVITLNIELIEKLLILTGPVGLAEYNLILDASNFRDEVQYEVEVGYDKKLNRPKQVLADFTPLFLVRLYEVWQNQKQDLLSILTDALAEKNVMLYFKERTAQEFLEEHGWAGSVKSAERADYLAVVHSNIGGYKTSKFMEQEIIRRAEVKEDGTIVGHLAIAQAHKGGNSKYWWYNKPNVDYVKVYVPKGAKFTSSAGGKRRDLEKSVDYQSLQFAEDPDIQAIEKTMSASGAVDIFEESGKTVFATWVVTKAKATSMLEIEYTLPYRVEFEQGKGAYRMYFQKQAGTSANVRMALELPESWHALEENPLEQSFILDKDREIQYILRR